jgi:hypothetical protein
MARKHNRFEHRFGQATVFACDICGRRTRMSGQDSTRLCLECFELAGLENVIFDAEDEDKAKARASVAVDRDYWFAKAVKLGSDPEKLKSQFRTLFPD